MFQIPAAQSDFQERAAEIKAAQKADAENAAREMQIAIDKWNAQSPEERSKKERRMQEGYINTN